MHSWNEMYGVEEEKAASKMNGTKIERERLNSSSQFGHHVTTLLFYRKREESESQNEGKSCATLSTGHSPHSSPFISTTS
jgi:hypothetical protein